MISMLDSQFNAFSDFICKKWIQNIFKGLHYDIPHMFDNAEKNMVSQNEQADLISINVQVF